MKPISLDDLPRYSPWPERLLYENSRHPRTWSGVYKEYEDKYGILFDRWRTSEPIDYETIRDLELGEREVAMSYYEKLYAAPLSIATDRSLQAIMKYLLPEALLTRSVVDLGCGYGYLLHQLKVSTKNLVALCGGELTNSGVNLANRLDPDLKIQKFDFRANEYELLEEITIPSVVTTSYALHQLPSSRLAIDRLARYREKIVRVVSLEPEESHFGEGLLGLLRKRYGAVNSYSADLGKVLKERDDVEVELVVPAVVGANALLPATVTIWRFI